MAKSTKSAAQQAASQQAAVQQAPDNNPRIDGGKFETPSTKGLTQGEKVAYIAALQTERSYMLKSTEKISQETVDGLTMLAQATIIDVAIGEIASGLSVVGAIITANENNYKALQAMAFERGIKLPEYKALPMPTEEQLKTRGLIGVAPAETRIVNVEASNVSEKAVAQKKKENEAVAKAVSNPAEIKNKEQLKASLTAMLVKPITDGTDRADARIQRTIKFYRGYLTIQANAAENKKEALDNMKAMTRQQMLNEIAEIVGPCPFSLHGAAWLLRNRTAETGSPISAFCLYRRTSVPEKDNIIDDQYIADMLRILTIWSCNSRIAECEQVIKEQNKHLKNETGTAKVATETAIRANEKIISENKQIIEWITDPNFDIVDKLIENYNLEDKESKDYKLAHRIVQNVINTYYPELKDKEVNESILVNVKQRAGIILNLFCSPLNQNQSYSEANLTEIESVEEEKKEEEKPAE